MIDLTIKMNEDRIEEIGDNHIMTSTLAHLCERMHLTFLMTENWIVSIMKALKIF